VEPLIPPAKRGGNGRTVNAREVVNGLMYVLSTGCQWRAIPKDLPPRSTVYDYFDARVRWDDGRPQPTTLRCDRNIEDNALPQDLPYNGLSDVRVRHVREERLTCHRNRPFRQQSPATTSMWVFAPWS
jgi:Putative transposase of IS4/5 family (DUF4096)